MRWEMRVNRTLKIYDGNIHNQVGGYFIDLTFALLGVITIIWFRDWVVLSRLGLVYLGARLGNHMISPDLDLGRSVPKSKWGIISFIWLPYSTFVKHRSIWSHGIVVPLKWRKHFWKSNLFKTFGFLVGTLVRSIYLSLLVLLLSLTVDWIIGYRLFSALTPQMLLSEITLYLLIGMACSDFAHTRFDLITTKSKQ
jgi:uncharacterized metal-binding protein